jgi:hypothetical protein
MGEKKRNVVVALVGNYHLTLRVYWKTVFMKHFFFCYFMYLVKLRSTLSFFMKLS